MAPHPLYAPDLAFSGFGSSRMSKGSWRGNPSKHEKNFSMQSNVFWTISIQRCCNRVLRTQWLDFEDVFKWKSIILRKVSYHYFIKALFSRGLEMLHGSWHILSNRCSSSVGTTWTKDSNRTWLYRAIGLPSRLSPGRPLPTQFAPLYEQNKCIYCDHDARNGCTEKFSWFAKPLTKTISRECVFLFA
jgi:hypothetical protein